MAKIFSGSKPKRSQIFTFFFTLGADLPCIIKIYRMRMGEGESKKWSEQCDVNGLKDKVASILQRYNKHSLLFKITISDKP